jgi:hypothetical protein
MIGFAPLYPQDDKRKGIAHGRLPPPPAATADGPGRRADEHRASPALAGNSRPDVVVRRGARGRPERPHLHRGAEPPRPARRPTADGNLRSSRPAQVSGGCGATAHARPAACRQRRRRPRCAAPSPGTKYRARRAHAQRLPRTPKVVEWLRPADAVRELRPRTDSSRRPRQLRSRSRRQFVDALAALRSCGQWTAPMSCGLSTAAVSHAVSYVLVLAGAMWTPARLSAV